MANIADLVISSVTGSTRLYTASFASGGLGVFNVRQNNTLQFLENQNPGANRGTEGVVDIDVAQVGDKDLLLPAGRYDDNLAFVQLNSGGFGNSLSAWSSGSGGNFTQTVATTTKEGVPVLVGARAGISGLQSYTFDANEQISLQSSVTDTASTYVNSVSAITTVETNKKVFVFAIDPFEDGISSYWIDLEGNLRNQSSFGLADGLAISAATALETVIVDGLLYVILADPGTSSLTVLRVNSKGQFTMMDQVWDERLTKFGNVTAIETYEVEGRSFLTAGGSDGGVTTYEVLPRGQLIQVGTWDDGLDTATDDVNALAAQVFDTFVQLFVASENEDGFAQLDLNFGNIGPGVYGTTSRNTLNGDAGDNLIWGWRGRDFLYGGAGDDTIFDGKGQDRMIGEEGADRFVFIDDNQNDTVLDFQQGTDVLDMSLIDGLYSMSQLEFDQRSWGAALFFEGQKFFIYSDEGGTILNPSWSEDDFIF